MSALDRWMVRFQETPLATSATSATSGGKPYSATDSRSQLACDLPATSCDIPPRSQLGRKAPATSTLCEINELSSRSQKSQKSQPLEPEIIDFEERAAFLEFDGELSREEAEARAFEWCIVEWLEHHPVTSTPGRCAWCGEQEGVDAVIVPFGTDTNGHTWLHHACWKPWHQRQRERAIKELRKVDKWLIFQQNPQKT